MNDSNEIPARSSRGLEILKDAFNRGESILEFRQDEDGTITIIPITDHVNTLEEKVDDLENRVEKYEKEYLQ